MFAGCVGGAAMGEYTDPTGLIYLRARYYDPTSGRVRQRRPGTRPLDSTQAPYSYAGGNPVNLVDPTDD